MAYEVLGLIVGTAFGIAGIGVSIYLAIRVEGLLRDMRRSQIDEKIAVTYRTASEVETWRKLHIDPTLVIDKVVADLRAALRVRKSMTELQFKQLMHAMGELITVLKKHKFTEQAKRLEKIMSRNV